MNANKQRGEVLIKGPNDEDFKLKLTLGAIAQIEDEIVGLESLADIGEVMEKTRVNDLITILVALLHGGGHKDITREDMMEWDVDMKTLSTAIGAAFKAAGFSDEDEDGDEGSEGN